jgi:hypothetical protein
MGAFLSVTRITCSHFGVFRKRVKFSASRRFQFLVKQDFGCSEEFSSECRAEYLKLVKNKTSVFEYCDSSWEKTRAIDIKPLDTVILDEIRRQRC